ncbi:hypothetical protein EYF80_066698 [Liparis tanakae]|uniref:Uncharacterized protein n=1 Tax=Liparis tanakae TaxID=230148 RepID=A0A4Z2E3F3_9TELE|nr:hypothetical protein EYF80_066698 [Liparis tanakae]
MKRSKRSVGLGRAGIVSSRKRSEERPARALSDITELGAARRRSPRSAAIYKNTPLAQFVAGVDADPRVYYLLRCTHALEVPRDYVTALEAPLLSDTIGG